MTKKKEAAAPEFDTVSILNGHLEELIEATRSIVKGARLDPAVRLRFAWMRRELADAYGAVLEVQNDLVREYGEDGSCKPDMDGWEEFETQYLELMNTEAEIDVDPIPWEMLEGEKFGDDFDRLLDFGLIALPTTMHKKEG